MKKRTIAKLVILPLFYAGAVAGFVFLDAKLYFLPTSYQSLDRSLSSKEERAKDRLIGLGLFQEKDLLGVNQAERGGKENAPAELYRITLREGYSPSHWLEGNIDDFLKEVKEGGFSPWSYSFTDATCHYMEYHASDIDVMVSFPIYLVKGEAEIQYLLYLGRVSS